MPARTSRRTPASFWWDGSSPERSPGARAGSRYRSEEHTSELQSQSNLVCRLLLEKKKRRRPRVVSRQLLSVGTERTLEARAPRIRVEAGREAIRAHVSPVLESRRSICERHTRLLD